MSLRAVAKRAAVLLLVGWLAGCGQPPTVPGGAVRITVNTDISQHAGLQPQGTPVDPVTGETGITQIELTVFSGGTELQFDEDGNVVTSGGVPVMLVGNSVTLHLPHGTYDFHLEASDDEANILADGSALAVEVVADTTVTIDLLSFVGSASLIGPQVVTPNQVIDVALFVHPPGNAALHVPTSDYDVDYTSNALDLGQSKRGIRLVVECEEISVSAAVSDLRGSDPVPASLSLPSAAVCDSYDTGVGVDLIPPYLVVLSAPSEVEPGTEAVISGTVTDAQTGVASVAIFDGPVYLGNATIDDTSVENTWEFSFTPDQQRAYRLIILASDNAGNETRSDLEIGAATLRFTDVVTGGAHACGLVADGSAYCWGRGSSGRLGNGDVVSSAVPVGVSGEHVFQSLAAGGSHNCGLTVTGQAYCWGYGGSGQLGNGSTTSSSVPVLVSGHTFTAIDAGESHTCAIDASNVTRCWGYGANGQLGNGSSLDSATPVAVTGSHTFVRITAGGNHSCGLLASGLAYCWGRGTNGQLGTGLTAIDRNVPTQVAGSIQFQSIDAGYYHTCGVNLGNAAYCWGDGGQGRLGFGGTNNQFTPVQVPGHTFAAVSGGLAHTCGVNLANATYCWGNGSNGQLGDGTNMGTNPTPKLIAGHAFITVATGLEHTCGITDADETYCWGRGSDGQLGNGDTASNNTPVRVTMPELP